MLSGFEQSTEVRPHFVPKRNGGTLKFLTRLCAFLVPFALVASATMVVDPFNFFNVFHVISDAVKGPISNLHYVLWKMPEFKRGPVANILIGDSRMGAVRPETVERISGQKYYNFAYGGATLPEMINTFWFADSLVKLSNVVIGINFNNYNGFDTRDRTEDYRRISANPAFYFVNPTVLKAGWYDVRAAMGAKILIGVPHLNREAFWKYQLEVTALQMYKRYKYPTAYKAELQAIAQHCKSNGINLTFVVFPTHTDLQAEVKRFQLESERQRFMEDLSDFGRTFYYDYPNEVTSDRANFKDPFHAQPRIVELLVENIWGHKSSLPGKQIGSTPQSRFGTTASE
jgi:hypothetical protein